MPPPRLLAAKPLVMVRPAMVVVLAGAMRKTRLEPLPFTATIAGPGPRMERGDVMGSSPEVNEIVPETLGANTTVFVSEQMLARKIASRRLPAPESLRLSTVMVPMGMADNSTAPTSLPSPPTALVGHKSTTRG